MMRGGPARDTVIRLRDEARPHLSLTARVCSTHVKRGRHILVEQPMGSLAMKQPEMQPLRDLKDEGLLYLVRVWGCQLGYVDEETSQPFAKPMEL